MASIVKEVVIEAPPTRCWEAVRDFAALSERLAPGFVTGLEMVGPRERKITFVTGAVAHEYLIGTDDERMRLAYTVTKSALDASHHNSSVRVVAEGGTRCRFVWTSDVLPDELGSTIEQMMEAGLRNIKETLEAAG